MPSCANLELVIFIVPFNRLKGFRNASTSLVHKHPELEHKPIENVSSTSMTPATKSGYCFGCMLGLLSNKYSSCQLTILLTSMRLWLEPH